MANDPSGQTSYFLCTPIIRVSKNGFDEKNTNRLAYYLYNVHL